mgnify:CR=1 FL=1
MFEEQLAGLKTAHALEHYKNHLEFLGYSIEEVNEFSIFCRHTRRDSLRLFLLNRGAGVLAQMMFTFPERFKNDLIPLYMYANELNSIFLFTKAFIRTFDDGTPALVLSSVLEGDYSRQNFAVFLDNIEDDMKQFNAYPKTGAIWSTQSENDVEAP